MVSVVGLVWFSSEDGENVGLTHDEIFFAVEFDFCSGIFAIEHIIALFEYHFLIFGAIANGEHGAAERFFLGRVGDDYAGESGFFGRSGLNEHTVGEWFKFHDVKRLSNYLLRL